MASEHTPWKLGRFVALILMGLTVVFTLMGGIGTSCVALGAEKYESMVGMVPYKPLYQLIVILSIAIGIWGIPVMISLVRGSRQAYRNALIILIIGAATSGVQTAISQSVRGSSAPANVRFAVTLLTLIVFLIFRLPSLWRRMRFDQPLRGASGRAAGGMTMATCGILTLASPFWVARTHLAIWLSDSRIPLLLIGLALTLAGVGLLAAEVRYNNIKTQIEESVPA